MIAMATYCEIKDYVKKKHDRVMKDCWIAHAKEQCDLHPRKAYNRYDETKREIPCPVKEFKWIKEAFSYFKMI